MRILKLLFFIGFCFLLTSFSAVAAHLSDEKFITENSTHSIKNVPSILQNASSLFFNILDLIDEDSNDSNDSEDKNNSKSAGILHESSFILQITDAFILLGSAPADNPFHKYPKLLFLLHRSLRI